MLTDKQIALAFGVIAVIIRPFTKLGEAVHVFRGQETMGTPKAYQRRATLVQEAPFTGCSLALPIKIFNREDENHPILWPGTEVVESEEDETWYGQMLEIKSMVAFSDVTQDAWKKEHDEAIEAMLNTKAGGKKLQALQKKARQLKAVSPSNLWAVIQQKMAESKDIEEFMLSKVDASRAAMRRKKSTAKENGGQMDFAL